MAVYKRKYPSGKTTWGYIFDAPASTKTNRRQIKASPFASKKDAQDAEAKRRMEAQHEYEASLRDAVAPLPTTLRGLIEDFCKEHADKNLAPKTVERYREAVAYIDPDLLSMPVIEITPLHLTVNGTVWARRVAVIAKSKMHGRCPAKRFANTAGVVSSAFGRAIRWVSRRSIRSPIVTFPLHAARKALH
jgi:hypothetical protein